MTLYFAAEQPIYNEASNGFLGSSDKNLLGSYGPEMQVIFFITSPSSLFRSEWKIL